MEYPKIGVGIVFLDKKNRILLGHRIKDDSWGLVGGKIDWCETFEEASIRESKEEVGLTPTKLKYFGINNAINKPSEHHITLFYHAVEYTGILKNNEPDKHHEWKWFDLDELPENLFLPFRINFPKIKKYIIKKVL